MQQVLEIILSSGFLHSILRVSTPIILAGLAAVFSERSGVINVSIEGVMLSSALLGVVSSSIFQSAWIGYFLAVCLGVILSLFLGFLTLKLNANSVLSGLALNVLAQGGTVFALFMLTGSKGNSIGLESKVLPSVSLPIIRDIPVIGTIFSGHNVITYLAIIAVIVSHIFMFKTRQGVRLRVSGENPDALVSVGVSVFKTRMLALMIAGVFAASAGVFLSMGYMNGFTANMTSGRGFIGIAANAMGNQLPLGTLFASLIFGAADAAANSLQTLKIPPQFIQMLPYATTIIGITIYSIQRNRKIQKRMTVGDDND